MSSPLCALRTTHLLMAGGRVGVHAGVEAWHALRKPSLVALVESISPCAAASDSVLIRRVGCSSPSPGTPTLPPRAAHSTVDQAVQWPVAARTSAWSAGLRGTGSAFLRTLSRRGALSLSPVRVPSGRLNWRDAKAEMLRALGRCQGWSSVSLPAPLRCALSKPKSGPASRCTWSATTTWALAWGERRVRLLPRRGGNRGQGAPGGSLR